MPSVNGRQNAAAPGIAVENIRFAYGDRPVLEGIDVSVEQGSLLALAGPNGAGKSTLLKLIAGVLKPARGTIEVLGDDVTELSARQRARLVTMVPQNPELPPGAAALEVVLLGRNPHLGLLSWEREADLDAAVNAMRKTSAEDLLDRSIDELSGGERQRVAVAMALAQETPVVLLDEPTANLDLAYQSAVMLLLRELVALGKTVVTAVHDLTLAAQFADKVALIHEGRCVAAGPVRQVLTSGNIRRAYGAETTIIDHPETGKPVVVSSWRSTACQGSAQ